MIIEMFGIRTSKSIFNLLNTIDDKDLRKSIQEFLTCSSVQLEDSSFYQKNAYKAAYCVKEFIHTFKEVKPTLKSMNWQTYCEMMHRVTNSVRSDDTKTVRVLIKSYYSNLYFNENTIDNFDYIEEYFLTTEARFSRMKNEIETTRILTNFPLNSKVFQISQVATQANGTIKVNIFLNTENNFLLQLLKRFIPYYLKKDIGRKKVLDINGRVFFYYFEQSLNQKVKSIQDFNGNIFKGQYEFYSKLVLDVKTVITLLKAFYLFINDLFLEENGVYLFDRVDFNRNLIRNGWFTKYLEEGYTIIFRSNFEDVPNYDKWLIVKKAETQQAMYTHSNISLDFTKIKDDSFKKELKSYIWNLNISDKYLVKIFSVLTDFLNYITDYYCNSYDLKVGKNTEPFTNFLVLQYIEKVKVEAKSKNSKDEVAFYNIRIGTVKNYLNHIKSFYLIDELTINQLKTKAIKNIKGNPISYEEIKVISEEFNSLVDSSLDGELFNIVFKLSLTTKLRLGEILNLKSNCIVEKFENYGVISYTSKTSKFKLEEFLIEDVLLIEKAINLTEERRNNAHDELRNYIFITENKRKYKNELTLIGSRYSQEFTRIIKKLYNQGKIKKNYIPYNARDTFINEAWKMVEDDLISILEVKAITGNTANVAAKHYRNRETRRYIEATYMIIIGDVSINGEILESEEALGNLESVEQGAGACSSIQCIKLEDENSDYKCLTCSKFVTSFTRKEIFEKRLEHYVALRNDSKVLIEKDYYNQMIQLYAAYLERFYEYLEDAPID